MSPSAPPPSPKCFRCKKSDAAFFPAFRVFTAYKPQLLVALLTMDVAFCGQCQGELTVGVLLVDSVWQQLVQRVHRDLNGRKDSTGQPMPAPKLDRGRTELHWAPFMRTGGPSAIVKP